MATVYLIRHADVENPRGVLYGHLEGFPLSSRGRERAKALGESLRSSGIRHIVSSPLERARETAEVIASFLPGSEIEIEPELREAEFSRYLQGLRYWQIPLLRPRWYLHKFVRRGMVPDDETIEAMGGRILEVARRLARKHPAEASAIVSHADPIQAAWILLDGRPHNEREMYRKSVDRAGLLKVDFEADRPVRWEYIKPPLVEGEPARKKAS